MVLPELRQGGPRGGQKISVRQEMLLNLSGSSEELSALVLVLQARLACLSKRERKPAILGDALGCALPFPLLPAPL